MPSDMHFREAAITDIPQLHVVRIAVKENSLSNPALITVEDYANFVSQRGKGWVCEIDGKIAGFAIADLQDNNVWALFVHPDAEGKGIGSRLHDMMLDWYFQQTQTTIWLGTSPGTRAEQFYRLKGWTEDGANGEKEVRFIMTFDDWTGGNYSTRELL